MPALFSALAALYTSAAQCAAALGITRQAFQQAQKRRRLSEPAALRAAALPGIDPAAALLTNATKDAPAPITHPAPDTPAKIQGAKKPPKLQAEKTANNVPTTNYAQLDEPKKSASIGTMRKIVHVIPQTEKRLFEIDCVKWMLCVPRISPDSPRFVQYFSRWVVPEKIAASKLRNDFDDITKNCPIFSPHLLDFIPAAMAEYYRFTKRSEKTAELDPPAAPCVNIQPLAA